MQITVLLKSTPEHPVDLIVMQGPKAITYMMCAPIANRLLRRPATAHVLCGDYRLTLSNVPPLKGERGWRAAKVRWVFDESRNRGYLQYFDPSSHQWDGMYRAMSALVSVMLEYEIFYLGEGAGGPWRVWFKLEAVTV